MAPTLVRPPFHREGWVYEEKVDGWRMVAYKEGPRVRLISRNALDHTTRFIELAAAVAKLDADVVVLDGEVAVYDEKLLSRFHLLGDPDTGIVCTPPVLIAFDVLQLGRHDLRRRPLTERRPILEDLLRDVDMVLPCRRLPDDGAKAWAIVEERGYEGMVAKDPRSTYHAGPTKSWVKLKVRHEGVFLVGGIRNIDAFDGVIVGEQVGDELRYGVWSSGASGRPTCWSFCAKRGHRRGRRRSSTFARCAVPCGSSRGFAPRSATLRLSENDCVRRLGAAF